MDYRVLNSWTVCDKYPLPLINTILEQLQGKELFTKFDIRWGYENICIREEDQRKVAFKTPLGLFQPQVMFLVSPTPQPPFVARWRRCSDTSPTNTPQNSLYSIYG